VQSTALSSCTCNAGWWGADGGTCRACVAGKYKSAAGSGSCDDCPTASNSPIGSITIANCICNAGWSGPDGNCKVFDIFDAFDHDGDSRINKNEYMKGFDILDLDKNGLITGQEFGILVRRSAAYFKILDKDDDDCLFLKGFETGFSLFDIDGSGFITREELYGSLTPATRLNGFNLGDTIARIRCV
jgi:hypothetical protein